MNKLTFTDLKSSLPRRSVLIGWLVLIGIFLWSYSAVIDELVGWWLRPDYGHGFFVPVFAIVLLWVRREMILPLPERGSWWAMAFFAVWGLMRLISAALNMKRTDEWSILLFAAGVAVFLGGWRALRWAWPSIVFLYFMIPLPGAIQNRLSFQLQTIATKASVYAIQTLGIPTVIGGPEGHVIQLPANELGVAEACSGIRMLMLFFAICVGAAFLLRCPLWKKAVIVVSAVPIAVFSNVCRITVTAILYEVARKWPEYVSEEAAKWFFHDAAGWMMMPLGLLLLLGLWKLLENLIVDRAPEGPLALGGYLASDSSAAKSHSKTNP